MHILSLSHLILMPSNLAKLVNCRDFNPGIGNVNLVKHRIQNIFTHFAPEQKNLVGDVSAAAAYERYLITQF